MGAEWPQLPTGSHREKQTLPQALTTKTHLKEFQRPVGIDSHPDWLALFANALNQYCPYLKHSPMSWGTPAQCGLAVQLPDGVEELEFESTLPVLWAIDVEDAHANEARPVVRLYQSTNEFAEDPDLATSQLSLYLRADIRKLAKLSVDELKESINAQTREVRVAYRRYRMTLADGAPIEASAFINWAESGDKFRSFFADPLVWTIRPVQLTSFSQDEVAAYRGRLANHPNKYLVFENQPGEIEFSNAAVVSVFRGPVMDLPPAGGHLERLPFPRGGSE